MFENKYKDIIYLILSSKIEIWITYMYLKREAWQHISWIRYHVMAHNVSSLDDSGPESQLEVIIV